MSCVSSMLMSHLNTKSRVELTGYLDDIMGKILSSLHLDTSVDRTPAHVHGHSLVSLDLLEHNSRRICALCECRTYEL